MKPLLAEGRIHIVAEHETIRADVIRVRRSDVTGPIG